MSKSVEIAKLLAALFAAFTVGVSATVGLVLFESGRARNYAFRPR